MEPIPKLGYATYYLPDARTFLIVGFRPQSVKFLIALWMIMGTTPGSA